TGSPMSVLGQKRTCTLQKAMSALPSKATLNATSGSALRARSGNYCGSSSFGKLFMPLGTAILTAVIKLLGEPGLGTTTLTPTQRTAVTIKAMDRVWRITASFLSCLDC